MQANYWMHACRKEGMNSIVPKLAIAGFCEIFIRMFARKATHWGKLPSSKNKVESSNSSDPHFMTPLPTHRRDHALRDSIYAFKQQSALARLRLNVRFEGEPATGLGVSLLLFPCTFVFVLWMQGLNLNVYIHVTADVKIRITGDSQVVPHAHTHTCTHKLSCYRRTYTYIHALYHTNTHTRTLKLACTRTHARTYTYVHMHTRHTYVQVTREWFQVVARQLFNPKVCAYACVCARACVCECMRAFVDDCVWVLLRECAFLLVFVRVRF